MLTRAHFHLVSQAPTYKKTSIFSIKSKLHKSQTVLTNQDLFFTNFIFFFGGGGGGNAVCMFGTIWEYAQSQDCIVHSQNPKIAFQSRDCAI